jgi:lipoate-protein ligase A
MQFLDLSLSTPAENLALDELLLEQVEQQARVDPDRRGALEGILRVWESPAPFVVIGYGNKVAEEVNAQSARRDAIPILRRVSGGGTVLQGPGCVNYAVILPLPQDLAGHPLRNISSTNEFVIGKNAQALRRLLGDAVSMRGLSDLTRGLMKFSGNAQRRKKYTVLVHGTFLLDYDLPLIARTLLMPKRQPDYRQNRPHLEFVTNAGIAGKELIALLRETWGAHRPMPEHALPLHLLAMLAREKYSRAEHNLRL